MPIKRPSRKVPEGADSGVKGGKGELLLGSKAIGVNAVPAPGKIRQASDRSSSINFTSVRGRGTVSEKDVRCRDLLRCAGEEL